MCRIIMPLILSPTYDLQGEFTQRDSHEDTQRDSQRFTAGEIYVQRHEDIHRDIHTVNFTFWEYLCAVDIIRIIFIWLLWLFSE